jgi:hypothetical protein
MRIDAHGTFTIVDPDAWVAWLRQGEQDTRARIQEMSRLSGLPVEYDLSMFDLDWNPIYVYGTLEPIAWINNKTRERREGAEMPAA